MSLRYLIFSSMYLLYIIYGDTDLQSTVIVVYEKYTYIYIYNINYIGTMINA